MLGLMVFINLKSSLSKRFCTLTKVSHSAWTQKWQSFSQIRLVAFQIWLTVFEMKNETQGNGWMQCVESAWLTNENQICVRSVLFFRGANPSFNANSLKWLLNVGLWMNFSLQSESVSVFSLLFVPSHSLRGSAPPFSFSLYFIIFCLSALLLHLFMLWYQCVWAECQGQTGRRRGERVHTYKSAHTNKYVSIHAHTHKPKLLHGSSDAKYLTELCIETEQMMHEPHTCPEVGQGSPDVGVSLGTYFSPPLLDGVM